MLEESSTDGEYAGVSSTHPSSQPSNTKRTSLRRPWAFKARPEQQPHQPATPSPTSPSEVSDFSGPPIFSYLSTASDPWMCSASSNFTSTLTCLAQSTPASPIHGASEAWCREQGYVFLEDEDDNSEQIWIDSPTFMWDFEAEELMNNTRRSRKWPKRGQRERVHGDESKQHSRQKMTRRTQGVEGRNEEELEN